jgi:hypothetical protein
MPLLAHLMFGGAIAILIAMALTLLFRGSRGSSRPQQAHVSSSPLPMQ